MEMVASAAEAGVTTVRAATTNTQLRSTLASRFGCTCCSLPLSLRDCLDRAVQARYPVTVMPLILGFSVPEMNWITTWPLPLAVALNDRAMAERVALGQAFLTSPSGSGA